MIALLGQPVVPPYYESKSCISNIQHVHACLEFCKENFDAVITQGITFRGKDFNVKRVFCDLTLRYNPVLLRQFLASDIDTQSCRALADDLCKTGLELSDALQKDIRKLQVH